MTQKDFKRELELDTVRYAGTDIQELKRLTMQSSVTRMNKEIESLKNDEYSMKDYEARLSTRYPVNASLLESGSETGRVEIQFYDDREEDGGLLVVTGIVHGTETDVYNIIREGFKAALRKIPTMTSDISKTDLRIDEI